MDPAGVQPQIPSCFQIHEIVTIIAEILLATGRDLIRYHADGTAGPVEFDQPDYASVAFFARTCQATVGPGLRVLWSHQEGLEHLIKTLPRDARAFKFSLTRYISCSEWERFDYYASLIQTLSVKYDGWSLRWAPEVIAALHVRQTSLRRDLLPNLREVKLKTLEGDDHPSYAFFFLSRLLGSISITAGNVPSYTAWLKSFISYLPLSSPHLESITLKLEYLEKNPLPLEIESASSWSNLSTFNCEYSVTLSTALQLVQLPKLGALSLVVPAANTDPAPSHPIAHTARNVKRLGISSHILLDHCVFPSLETIEIRPGSQNELRSSLESIQKRCDLELLHGVEIMCPEMKGDPTKIDDFAPPRSLDLSL
ncbi:hypothetical protein NLI96_g1330 [Meripilus lineatus]|uniref:Uncharacterized protein n=1 Tax=Meripilus lineatus TaxID=2056292 RepID=A0AAD5VAI6_9APHY|nr:hypothetical protein NLI96_g1330 [Physisporinus lineatus]